MLGLEFPPINEILRWQDVFPTFNKIALIAVAAALISIVLFLIASRRDPMVAPTGVRNLAEVTIDFIEESVVMQTLGKSGLKWTPFLLSLFLFIFLCNIPGVIPIIQMPATARIAIPLSLSLLVWVIYIGTGIKHQGLGYFGHLLWPPGVPTALKPLVGLIEFISTILVTPVLAHGASHGQHARRPHPARDLQLADRVRCSTPRRARSSSCRWASCRSACSSS